VPGRREASCSFVTAVRRRFVDPLTKGSAMPRLSDARTIASVSCMPTSSITELSALYARVVRGLPATPRYGQERGYRVFWTERGALRHRDLVAVEGGFAILGRHSRAHIRLLDDPTVALRHAILRAEITAAGGVALRMTDLLAPIGTCIEGDLQPRFSFVAEGEVCARVGSHAFCALPFDGCAPLPPHGGPGRADRPDPTTFDDVADADDVPARRPEVSEVLPRERLREQLAEHATKGATITPSLRPQHVDSLPPSAGPIVARLTLLGNRGRLSLALDAAQLEGTVILGRYDRCTAGKQVFSEHVSRMHVALRKVEGGLEAIDLASTNGMRVHGETVHRVVITERNDLVLADHRDERVRIELVG
jgi:hypothetical protein